MEEVREVSRGEKGVSDFDEEFTTACERAVARAWHEQRHGEGWNSVSFAKIVKEEMQPILAVREEAFDRLLKLAVKEQEKLRAENARLKAAGDNMRTAIGAFLKYENSVVPMNDTVQMDHTEALAKAMNEYTALRGDKEGKT